MDTDISCQRRVIKEFGPTILDETGKIDRDKVAAVIFSNPEKRSALNKITHPRIFKKIIKEIIRLKFKVKNPLVVLDAPLLYEAKILEWFCYPILVVYTEDGRTQLKRLMERNKLSEEEALKKINA